jgi:hypothetical protein
LLKKGAEKPWSAGEHPAIFNGCHASKADLSLSITSTNEQALTRFGKRSQEARFVARHFTMT